MMKTDKTLIKRLGLSYADCKNENEMKEWIWYNWNFSAIDKGVNVDLNGHGSRFGAVMNYSISQTTWRCPRLLD